MKLCRVKGKNWQTEKSTRNHGEHELKKGGAAIQLAILYQYIPYLKFGNSCMAKEENIYDFRHLYK